MYAMLCGMFRSGSGPSDGGAVVTGGDLARAMPRVPEASIRGTLDRLEQNNKVMVDGPNEGLEGVTVHEIVDEPGAVREREGGQTGKRHAAQQLVRGSGRQTAVHGHNCTVEWAQQKRGKDGRGEAGGGCAGRGRAPEQEDARERGVGGARQAGAPGAGGCREASKSGGAGSGSEIPLYDGEAGCAVRTAPVPRTQNFQPRSKPPVECETAGGGVGMSKSGGEGTNSATAAGQSGGGLEQRGEAEVRGGGKRTREADPKETQRGRKGARGVPSEPLIIKNNNTKKQEKNRAEPGTDGSYLRVGHIKTRIGRPHSKQHANETVGGKGDGHIEEEEGQVPICGPHQEGGEGSGSQGACGRIQGMGGEADRGQQAQGGDREGRLAAAAADRGGDNTSHSRTGLDSISPGHDQHWRGRQQR